MRIKYLFIIILSIANICFAQNFLEGIKEFYVDVNIPFYDEYLSDDIQQETELGLRYYNINVIDNPNNSIAPFLSVKILLHKIKLKGYDFNDDLFVYTINLEFYRLMSFNLESATLLVWRSNLVVGSIQATKLKSEIKESTSDLLKYFINDYLEQND